MRKENSAFQMNFITESGTRLHNNDYFSSVEDTEFACYVVADGLGDGNNEDISARLAVEAVLTAFQAKQSLSKRAMKRYIRAAHQALLNNPERKRLRAAITVVVTDYQRVRAAHVGNTRFHLYRGLKLFVETKDQSLSWDLMEKGEITKDRVATHEERNNLQVFLGQKGSPTPRITKKIKLKDGDALALFTRGIWENCDHNDILFAIEDGEKNEPEEKLDNLERLILDSKQDPEVIDNYTMGLVFVDKAYVDPNKGKKLKLFLQIAIPVVIILAIVIVILVIWNNNRAQKRLTMEAAFINAVEYIQGDNYVRALEEIESAHELATDLKDTYWQTEIMNHRKLIEAVILADEYLDIENYEEAVNAFLSAQSRSRYTDNLGLSYITRKLENAGDYLTVHDYLYLGDTLADNGDYDAAEEQYQAARRLATSIHYLSGKQEAIDALELLYDRRQEQVDEYADSAASEIAATEYIVEGDRAFADGDLVGAMVYYQIALERYTELGNDEIIASINAKMILVTQKESENAERQSQAESYVAKGDQLVSDGEYTEAKRQYILAREIYSSLSMQGKVDEVAAKIEIVDAYIARVQSEENEAA